MIYSLAKWYMKYHTDKQHRKMIRIRQYQRQEITGSRAGQTYRIINVWPGDEMTIYGAFSVNGIDYPEPS